MRVVIQEESIKIKSSLVPGFTFVGIAWGLKMIEYFSLIDLSYLGIYPRNWASLGAILTAPIIHGSFTHLLSNTFPMLLLSGFVFYAYPRSARPLSIWLILANGLWTWSFAREAYHIGASGLVYGYASFLFFQGVFKPEKKALAFSLLMIFLYSGLLLGLIPEDTHISWESHLSGAIAGLAFAYLHKDLDINIEETFSTFPEEEETEEITLEQIIYWDPKSGKSRKIFPKKK